MQARIGFPISDPVGDIVMIRYTCSFASRATFRIPSGGSSHRPDPAPDSSPLTMRGEDYGTGTCLIQGFFTRFPLAQETGSIIIIMHTFLYQGL